MGSFYIYLEVMILLFLNYTLTQEMKKRKGLENKSKLLHLSTWIPLLLLVDCTILWVNIFHILASQCEQDFYLFYLRFWHSVPMCGVLFYTPPSNSLTPTGWPTIQLNSDVIYQEIASVSTGNVLGPTRLPSTSDANHMPRLLHMPLTNRP